MDRISSVIVRGTTKKPKREPLAVGSENVSRMVKESKILVEAGGIEPPSEDRRTTAATRLVLVLISPL